MTDTICDQKSLSHPSLAPVLSPGKAQSANADAKSPIIIGIRSQIARPNVARVRNRENIPAVKSAITPKIPNISAHHGASMMSRSLASFGRWGTLANRATSCISRTQICFFASFIFLILRIKYLQYNLINCTCNSIFYSSD